MLRSVGTGNVAAIIGIVNGPKAFGNAFDSIRSVCRATAQPRSTFIAANCLCVCVCARVDIECTRHIKKQPSAEQPNVAVDADGYNDSSYQLMAEQRRALMVEMARGGRHIPDTDCTCGRHFYSSPIYT